MATPLISVVIPTYNRAQTIGPTLQSVVAQTFSNFECIVVDDGSADVEELEAVVARLNDPRFRVLRRENGGGGAARNTGIEAARGDWIAFLDSDDLFLPEKLAVYQQYFEGSGPKCVFYSQNLVDRGVGKNWVRPWRAIRSDEDVGEYLFVDNCVIQTSTIVISASLIKEVMFDASLRKGQDLDLCIRLAAAGAEFRMITPPQSIWTDQSEHGRTSRRPGYDAPAAWLEKTAPLMTRKAVLGYRATTLAYYMAQAKPFTALRYILEGWLRGGVSFKVTLRQVLRAFVPRGLYRRLVNLFVGVAGV
jgi:glycosyltransferase involved in cell wall biosynthesis